MKSLSSHHLHKGSWKLRTTIGTSAPHQAKDRPELVPSLRGEALQVGAHHPLVGRLLHCFNA
jgi:hypothetical protein